MTTSHTHRRRAAVGSGESTRRGPAIAVRGIAKRFGASAILDGVSLDIDRGEVLVVLGPSGSGKTTLLKIIAGLERPDRGDVRLDGRAALNLTPQERNLGVVFQDHALFQHMTVERNIAFGLEIRNLPAAAVRRKVDEMLELTRLDEHRKKLPAQLSGGQRQRVALARALAFEPEAMLFDEPYSALDAGTRTSVRREVRRLLKELDMPAFFITHDQEEALELADRVAILNAGRVEQVGTPYEVYNRPANEFVAAFLGGANLLLGRWRDGEVAVGAMRLAPPTEHAFAEDQPVKLVFRPEDVVLNFQPQLLGVPHYLGKALVDDVIYAGATERVVLRLMLRPLRSAGGALMAFALDESFSDGVHAVVSRSKYDAAEIPLSPGDPVVVGVKEFRLLPDYPIAV